MHISLFLLAFAASASPVSSFCGSARVQLAPRSAGPIAPPLGARKLRGVTGHACALGLSCRDATRPASGHVERRDLVHIVGAALAVAAASPAAAERTFESMKKAKSNYLPRLKKGLTFYEGALREAIDAGDWDAVAAAVTEKGAAWNLAHVDSYSSGVVNDVKELKGPLKVFASSITATDSESQATQKLYSFLGKYAEFNGKLAEAAAAQDTDAAIRAWKGGCVALRLYVDLLNKEIPRSVGKMELPEPPFGRIDIEAPAADAEDED